MKVLIPWSGGVDSTYLIQYYLEKGHEVTAFYTKLINNGFKVEYELKAIDKIKEIFYIRYNKRFHFDEGKSSITLSVSSRGLCLSQPQVWLFDLFFKGINKHQEVAIGYIMNDDAISWLKEIEDLWYAYKPFSHYPENFPKISFPLIKFKKNDIIDRLDDEILKYCVTCESPMDDEEKGFLACGYCVACRKTKN